MKRSRLYTGIGFLAVGLVCLVLAVFFEWRIDGILWGLGGGVSASGIRIIWEYFHWTRPGKREEYERRLQAERVEMRDERNVMLRDKSGRITSGIMIVVYCILMFTLSFCSALGWLMPFARDAVIGLALLLVFQYICQVSVYQYLCKRL